MNTYCNNTIHNRYMNVYCTLTAQILNTIMRIIARTTVKVNVCRLGYIYLKLYINVANPFVKMVLNCLNIQTVSVTYACDLLKLKSSRSKIVSLIKKAYELHFGRKIGDRKKDFMFVLQKKNYNQI